MSETTLTLTDVEGEEVEAILGGLCVYQMKALAARDLSKMAAAGDALSTLAEENPEPVREAFLENRDAFRVANMPDEMLDHLDLKVENGKMYRPDEDDGWTTVEVE